MSAFLADPSFLAAHAAPLEFKFQSREGHMVQFNRHLTGLETNASTPASAYYVAPRDGVKSAVIMVHEWWGLNDYIKREAVKLHQATGYGVLAVDLYDGQSAATADEAGKLMAAANTREGVLSDTAIIRGAINALRSGTFGTRFDRLGTIGWCFGGGWSLQAAIDGGSLVRACVMYYGMPDDDPSHLAHLKAPVLLVEAMKDGWISPEVVGKFKTAMAEAHRSLTVRTYEADHAFANPSNPHYDKAGAQDAMAATLRFYKTHLGP